MYLSLYLNLYLNLYLSMYLSMYLSLYYKWYLNIKTSRIKHQIGLPSKHFKYLNQDYR
jgi:hypothetical protein